MRNVTKIAYAKAGRSFMCNRCPLHTNRTCNLDMHRACNNAFVEGFKKGVKQVEQQLKNYEKENSSKKKTT